MPKVIHQSYTPQQKEQAIAYVFLLGSYASASRMTNVPESTVRDWITKADKGEIAELRGAIRARVVQDAWAVAFRGLLQAKQAQDRYDKSSEKKEMTEERMAKLMEVAEKATRILKNIGVVAARMEIDQTVTVDDKRPEDLTIDDFLKLGRRAVTGAAN